MSTRPPRVGGSGQQRLAPIGERSSSSERSSRASSGVRVPQASIGERSSSSERSSRASSGVRVPQASIGERSSSGGESSRASSRTRVPQASTPEDLRELEDIAYGRGIQGPPLVIPAFPVNDDGGNNHYNVPASPDRHEPPGPHACFARRITQKLMDRSLFRVPHATNLRHINPNAHDLAMALYMTCQEICLVENRTPGSHKETMNAQWEPFLDIGYKQLEKYNTSALRTLMVFAWTDLMQSRTKNPNPNPDPNPNPNPDPASDTE